MLNEITVCGTPEGYDAKIILDELNKKHNSVIHVARDDKRMRAMSDAIEFFSPEIEVFTFPSWDCLPYDRVSLQTLKYPQQEWQCFQNLLKIPIGILLF